ncbi:hypothetical protein PTSG_08987 [Salpingoeca rosetta]|uniref:All-trans-retinol 13,14-reductase n=1 Tax=Salpingoeca rosetta (strain ATCC 50818 / BSB-021) TaxID=946362 RepID=F2ULW0_SALR5|nr:uncharacterized protein PTSG_08987 [Salpingoeca rosetta]EGD78109.1 hypothetical protein PTSG_08987 [Salpingoeca rosetta]|eukprot:XP_004989785.1 hypothetical protein PTSG_08987 [Salpingoeca rosetta]
MGVIANSLGAVFGVLPPWMTALVLVGGVVLAIVVYLRQEKSARLPRSYIPRQPLTEEEMPKHATEIHRDVYSRKKLPKDIDVIIIGSGISALTLGGLLSRCGRRVLVLEQHYIAGGATHMFEERGYEFDTGVHYIGNVSRRQPILDLVSEGKIEWDLMGETPQDIPKVYDEIAIGDHVYGLPAGRQAFIDTLAKRFPSERAGIEKWVQMCRHASRQDQYFTLKVVRPAWLARLLLRFMGGAFYKVFNMTALEAAQSVTDNKELQAVLLGQFGDHGQTPSKASFFMHASVVNHYIRGGYYPRGGSTVFAKKMIPAIERMGGRVLVQQYVDEVIVENNTAVGVRMRNGDVIRAREAVVSSAGVFNTYERLLHGDLVPDTILDKIEAIGPSCSMVYLFVGMRGTAEELGLRTSNIWHYPHADFDKVLEDVADDPETAPLPLFVGLPSAKDSTWKQRHGNTSTAVILTMCPHSVWEEWEGTEQGKRGEAYEAKKKMFGERMLEGFFHYYPKCRGKVDYTDVGSSLTFNHYLNSLRGEVYGLANDAARFAEHDWLRPETNIKNFYLTGQDIVTVGVTGALMAGVLTAHSMLGYGTLSDLFSGRNVIEDIMHLDKQQRSNS